MRAVLGRTYDGLILGSRAALASILAVFAARILRLQYPLYALISAVIVTDPSFAQTKQLSGRRLVSTAIGAAIGALVSYSLGHNVAMIGIAVLAAILICYLLGLRDPAKLAGYVAGLVILEHSSDPLLYAFYRFAETTVGIGAAFAVSVVWDQFD